jgi:hypothetical protein
MGESRQARTSTCDASGSRPLCRSIGLAAAAWLALSSLAPALADVLPPLRSRAEERQFTRPAGVPGDDVLQSSGAVIGEVRFVRINVFDPAIEAENTSLFRLANRIHIVTRESTVAAQLLFHSGDRYDPRVLQETERVLRSREYLREAHILPVAYRDGVVDIEVVTEDTWTLKPDVKFGRQGGQNSGGIGIEERNIFGTGGRLALQAKSDVDRTSRLLEYSDSAFLGSRWQVGTQLANNSDGHAEVLDVQRPFYALDTRWAGGIHLRNETRVDSIYDTGSIVEQYQTHEREATAFAGWSSGLNGRWVTRWTSGFTYDERRAGSLVSDNPAARLPQDRKLIYPWIGAEVAEDDFRVTRNLDLIGRTEDLALGWSAKVRLGFATRALGSDRQALVFDASAAKAIQETESHTLRWNVAATGRFADGALEDSIFAMAARYYWRQTAARTMYIGASVERGVNLDVDKQLTLGGDTGLRGYPIRYRTGQGRWLLTVEERAFTDWYPFRLFNVGGAVFYDVGATLGESQVPITPPPTTPQAKVLQDVGFGLRLGNSRSALGNVIHIDLAFPINADPSISKVQFIVEAKRTF